MSKSAVVGLALATRLLDFGDYVATGGAEAGRLGISDQEQHESG